MSEARRRTPPTTVDTVAAVKGASRGFTVLLVGGVVQPWVGHLLPPLGYVWLAMVAVAAFVVAAHPWRGPSSTPATAVVAALGSYLLVLPLVLSGAGGVPAEQLAGTAGTAVVVALATWAATRRRGADGATAGAATTP